MSRLFITIRSISGDAFGDGIGAIRYLVVPDGTQPAPSHAIPRAQWVKQVMQTFTPDAKGKISGDLLFLVHGYNDAMTDVVAQHDAITAGLTGKLVCTIVSFDWPSWSDTFAYLAELDVAKHTAIHLVNAGIRPLLAAQNDDCRVAIHTLCHSLGAYVVREALDHADDGTVTGSDWALAQLVLIAGDVEAPDFVSGNKDTESMLRHAYRLTNYFNKYDEALQISNVKRLGVEPRVGRVGLPPNAPPKTVNIDCSEHFEKIRRPGDDIATALSFSHSWYFNDPVFHTDLAYTLSGAIDRTVVPGRRLEADGRTLSLTG